MSPLIAKLANPEIITHNFNYVSGNEGLLFGPPRTMIGVSISVVDVSDMNNIVSLLDSTSPSHSRISFCPTGFRD